MARFDTIGTIEYWSFLWTNRFLCNFKKKVRRVQGFLRFLIFFKWRKGLGFISQKSHLGCLLFMHLIFWRQIVANDLFVLFTDQALKAIILFINKRYFNKRLPRPFTDIYFFFFNMKYFLFWLFLVIIFHRSKSVNNGNYWWAWQQN